MATTDTKRQLKDLLRELFQLNNTDLDFGIYRILNIKAKEVEEFIEKDIDDKIESVKDKIIDRQSGDIKAELEEVKAKLEKDFKVDFQKDGDLEAKIGQFGQLELFMEPLNRFNTAKEKLDNLRVSEDTEKSIYNELYRFFERYYEGGDFISKPRAGKNNYMIPYEGEEVKLYWANYDQYYIKTGDNFKNYLFNNQSADPKTFTQIEFRILDAETAINNNKEEKGRLFVPAEEPFEWIADERKLLVKFCYRVSTAEEKKIWGDKQSVKTDNKGINQKLAALVGEAGKKIGDTELLLFLNKNRTNTKGEAIPLFLYHLERYTTVNKFDYFIHKDLKGFLQRELDTFLKNDVFSIAFLDPAWKEQEVQEAIKNNVLKASAIRDIALVVIDFMSELEEFQKRLFEKKKFVVESHYCMTLDRIPASVYDEVIQYILTDKDKKQIQDWIDFKFIIGSELEPTKTKSKKDDEFADAKEFLKVNDKLVVDTKNLQVEIKWNLLAAFENIDEQTNGLLINSENFQALNLISNKYRNKIKSSYIDPPYNTEKNEFTYKDGFKSSTWLSMMDNRLSLTNALLSREGTLFISIDENEVFHLKNSIKKFEGLGTIIIETATDNNPSQINIEHEYILAFAKNKSAQEKWSGRSIAAEKIIKKYTELKQAHGTDIAKIQIELRKWIKQNKESLPQVSHYDNVDEKGVFHDGDVANTKFGGYEYEVLHPITGKPCKVPEKGFRFPEDTMNKMIADGDIVFGTDETTLIKPKTRIEGVRDILRSVIYEDGRASTKKFENMFFKSAFSNPKSDTILTRLFGFVLDKDDIIIDSFGGSGTTGHSVIELNKSDGGNRKYILIEMGYYFESILKPRINKVCFSDNWSNGMPQDGIRCSQIFQYLKLEQYEDSLNNIEIHTTAPQLSFLDNIRYQLIHGTKGSDSLINLDKFTKPFDYTMKIVQQNEPKEGTNIDLVTTFNFLLGIEVQRYVLTENNGLDYKVVIGKKGLQQYIIIWRNFDENSIDLKAEREFITKQDWYNTTAFVFCNGDNAFSAHPIEPEFIRLMNEPVL